MAQAKAGLRRKKRHAHTRVREHVVPERQSYKNLQRLWDTRFTPNNEEFRMLVAMTVKEAHTLRGLSSIVGIKQRHLRRILRGDVKAVSFRVADQILSRSAVSYRLRDLPWLTADELLDQGVWKPQWGNPRNKPP